LVIRHSLDIRHSSFVICLLCALCGSKVFAQTAANLQPDSGRDCAVCHVEWVDSFALPRAVTLMPKPDKPLVAEPETCLGCHDGSVDDARRKVWLEHGHKTGIAPPAGMKVPQELPLENGQLACRTCHTAHAAAGGGPVNFQDIVFLRLKNDAGQLCKSCHTDKTQGPEAGSHPLGKLDWKLPQTLADAGAHAGDDLQQVVCQTCHTAHGSKAEHLLVLGAESNQLCVTCHDKIRPALWRPEDGHEHPQSPPLRTASQRQAIKDMGTRMGPDNTMICLSCHKLHHGQAGRAMLADSLSDSRLCIRCHEDRANLVNSAHDLRKSAPQEPNARGQTPQQSGPCGSCHTFHSYARATTPANGDPQGVCVTCHDQNKVASKYTGQPFSHPSDIEEGHIPSGIKLALFPSPTDPKKKSVACLSCHDPHQLQQPHFLRSTGDELCANCHDQKVQSLAGDHDFTTKDLKNGRDLTAKDTGKCGFCHAVHNANGPAMWVATKNTPANPDALCAECHRPDAVAAEHPVAKFNHPTGPNAKPTTRPANANLPLFNAQAHPTATGFVACASCHDLHQSGKASKKYLRTTTITDLCAGCHPDKTRLAGGLHDATTSAKLWPGNNNKPTDLCTGCHKPHSHDDQRQRWAVAPQQGINNSDAFCGGCHPNNAPAASNQPSTLGAMMHPQTFAADSPVRQVAHGLPLEQTHTTPAADTIVCKTCHDPHTGPGVQHLLRTPQGAIAHELCLTCHKEPQYVLKSMHSPELLDPDKPVGHACHPCHATHAVKGSEKSMLWAAKKKPNGATLSERLCLGCHGPGGGAKVPTIIRHPETALKKLTEATTQPTELQKKLAAIDQITCSTCHLPHGREIITPTTSVATQPVLTAQRSAIKPMLRPDVDREICATCHGFDSTRVYLYFHNPKKREAIKKLMGE
jgi:predicted CXXCH cytochrome family protein